MRLAEHLAVLDIRSATLAPSRHMVCIHVLQIPNLRVVGIVADGAEQQLLSPFSLASAVFCA